MEELKNKLELIRSMTNAGLNAIYFRNNLIWTNERSKEELEAVIRLIKEFTKELEEIQWKN